MPDVEIPDKLYFKIGEVADLVGVEPHVLRYWEKEIACVRPAKSPSNQRRYRRRDVEIFREIRRLLYQERYTLAGARKRIGGGKGSDADGDPAPEAASAGEPRGGTGQANDAVQLAPLDEAKIAKVRAGLEELIRMAGEDPPSS